MKITRKLKNLVGIDESRSAPPPRYHTITDGLMVTATKAEAWFDLNTSNTDTATDNEKIANLTSVMTAAGKALGERHCHLKVLWGRYNGAAYVEEVAELYEGGMGDGRSWAADWGERIDELGLPQRHLMLGVVLEFRNAGTGTAVSTKANAAMGGDPERISDRALAEWQVAARRILKTLGTSPLRARQSSAEKIAWMLSRETARIKQAIPRDGAIKGAQLQQLVSSKAMPYADHVELTAEDGAPAMYAAVLPIIDFPTEMEIPGEAEWLRTLSSITKLGEITTADGGTEFVDVPVFADVSIRFQGMPRRVAMKAANEARRTAKEQRQSAAKHSAGEVSSEIEDAEIANEALVREIKNNGTSLVNHHSRLVVTAATKADLNDNCQAIIDHYADLGILVARGEDEQRDLWLEMLPGDILRVSDLGQVQTDVAFWGSFFWAGSKVGDSRGAISGFTTGTTASLFRSNVLGGGDRGDATTTFYGGRSGRGKSTALGLELISALLEGPSESWSTVIDGKGDLGGLVSVARLFNIPTNLVEITAEHSGAADLFRAVEPTAAPAAVQRQLAMLATDSAHMAIAASSTLRHATQELQDTEHPTTFNVIQRMCADEDTATRSFGRYLDDLAKSPLGKIVLGEPTGQAFLTDDPGLWLLQVPNLNLPPADSDPSKWDPMQRLSLALLQGITSYSLAISASKRLRPMRKGVAVPEVHLFLNAYGGTDFLDQIARMGRAFNTSLILDSQDCVSIASVAGLVEQLQGVRIFQLTSKAQQDAAAELLGMEPDASTRNLIRGLARTDNDETIRKGHALVRDWREQVATVQFDFPSAEVAEAMSTDPNATANRYDYDATQTSAEDTADTFQEVSA